MPLTGPAWSLFMRMFLAGAGLLSVMGPNAVAQTPAPVDALICWTPEQLAGTAREIAPRAGVRGARVAPPKRVLKAFPPTPEPLRGSIRRVKLPEGRKLIALTFDVGEAGYEIAGYDGRIVDYLRENKIRATFFISGKWLLTHPKRARQILADPLIEVANHGWRHANLKALSGASLTNEIEFAQAAYEEVRAGLAARACLPPDAVLPERMTLLRFPYGTCNARALKAVAEAGLLAIQWDLATGDPDRGQSARAIASRVLKNIRPGSIILGHANGRGWNAAKALPLYVPELKSRGYEFVTVSELLEAGTPEIETRCYDQRVGDTESWARGPKRKANEQRRKNRPRDEWNPFQQ